MHSQSVHAERLERVRARMRHLGVDVLLLSVGHDLPYLVGYHAMPLERLTMLVVPVDAKATLVIPRLEAPRVTEMPELFALHPWNETDDPVAITARLCGSARTIAVGDQMWARFLVELLGHQSGVRYVRAVDVVGPLRMRKDEAEIASLRSAAEAVDAIAAELQAGSIPLVGRTEAQVSADLSRRILDRGHEKVNFAIVAAGSNAASPHHHPGSRVIERGEIVLCDFGGTMNGYCSDITRCVHLGAIPSDIADAYAVLKEAQAAGVAAGTAGEECQQVDAASRSVIEAAGYGEYFVHRTGHGIGMEEHEDPYMVSGNSIVIEPGHAYSVEPGIYVPGRWGMRLEDIVVATVDGPVALNRAVHDLVVVDA